MVGGKGRELRIECGRMVYKWGMGRNLSDEGYSN